MQNLVEQMRAQQPALVAACKTRFASSLVRYGLRDPARADALIGSLFEACVLAAYGDFAIGGPDSRELEQVAAFGAASLTSDGANAFDIGALIEAIRETLGPVVAPYNLSLAFEQLMRWLVLVTCNALDQAKLARLTEQVDDELHVGTPIVEFGSVVVVFFVGSPTTAIIGQVLSRALMRLLACSATKLVIAVDGFSIRGFAAAQHAHHAISASGLTDLACVLVGESKHARPMYGWDQHSFC
jgi:hypothetical protein